MGHRSVLSPGWLLGLVAPLLVAACGGGDDPKPGVHGGDAGAGAGGEPAGSAGAAHITPQGRTIGPKGGVVLSDDGLLKLTIPPGALDRGTPISITAVDAEDSTAAVLDTTLRGAYRFEPDGTEFAEPATVEYTLEDFVTHDDDGAATLPMIVVTTESAGEVEATDALALDVNLDTNQALLTAPLSHFSQMAMNELGPGLDTLFFYVTVYPKPPKTSELGTDYGVGLFVHTKHALARTSMLTYDDESSNLDYSEGPDPYEIAAFGSNGSEPGRDIVPVGTYSCSEVGAATFSAHLRTDPLHFLPLLSVGRQGDGKPKGVAVDVFAPPALYDITITSELTCSEAGTTPGGMDGPPYSGLVDYQLHLEERQFDTTSSGARLNGAFYGGGAAQADFDAWVERKRRQLGLMDDREPSGVCRAVSPDDALLDNGLPPSNTVTHVASGAADVLAFSFPDTEQAEPALLAWLAPGRGYRGALEPPAVVEPSASGIEVFLPAGAVTPSIALPGWDPAIWQGFASFRGEDGFEITWDAELVQADHVHARIIGYSDAGYKMTECFAEVADQQLMIPIQTISDTFVPALNEEVPTLEVHMYSGRRTGVAYDGRALEGLVSHDTKLRY
jgi:hypothetical protein